jgi:hypothetical protein
MKKNLLFIACVLLFSAPVFAQEEIVVIEEEIIVRDTIPEKEIVQSSITFDGSPYNFIFSWKKKKAKESHWTGFGFAFADLKGLEEADLKMSKSYSIILNIGDYIVPMNQHWLFFTGVGMDFTRYHFKGNTGLREVDNITQFVPDRENEYKSSKLLAYYVTIPLMLEFQTKLGNDKVFFVNGGIEGMLKYYSKSQVDIRREEGTKKVELGRDLNILPINARLVLRAGFEDFSLFGYYQPYSMFKDGKGPDVNPYGIGVMLNF